MTKDYFVGLKLLEGNQALKSLEHDLEYGGDVYGWIYLIEPDWFEKLLKEKQKNTETWLILDHRMTAIAKELENKIATLHTWTWSYNRTMHDKTLFFPQRGIVHFTTRNLTKGSFWLSKNKSLRIQNASLTKKLHHDWLIDRDHARKVGR
jgi:hypothetical protein